jgi:hypothetical protein
MLELQPNVVYSFRERLVSALDREWDDIRLLEKSRDRAEDDSLDFLNDQGAAFAHIISELNRMDLSAYRSVGKFRRAVLELVEEHGKFSRQPDGTYRMPDGMFFEPDREDWESNVEFWLPGYLEVFAKVQDTFAVVSGGVFEQS